MKFWHMALKKKNGLDSVFLGYFSSASVKHQQGNETGFVDMMSSKKVRGILSEFRDLIGIDHFYRSAEKRKKQSLRYNAFKVKIMFKNFVKRKKYWDSCLEHTDDYLKKMLEEPYKVAFSNAELFEQIVSKMDKALIEQSKIMDTLYRKIESNDVDFKVISELINDYSEQNIILKETSEKIAQYQTEVKHFKRGTIRMTDYLFRYLKKVNVNVGYSNADFVMMLADVVQVLLVCMTVYQFAVGPDDMEISTRIMILSKHVAPLFLRSIASVQPFYQYLKQNA